MKSKRNLCFFVLVVMVAILFSGCEFFQKSATIEVKNETRWALTVTIDGNSRIMSGNTSDTWTIEWNGSGDYTVSMSARDSWDSEFASRSVTVSNGDSYRWTLYTE